MRIPCRLILTVILLTLFFNVFAVTETKAQVIEKILQRMDTHQKVLLTLSSKILMEKYNSQLAESDITEGTLVYARDGKVKRLMRVDWTKPTKESLAIVNSQFIIYRPRLNQAIVGRVDKTNGNYKIDNSLAFLRMSKSEIKSSFNISYLGEEKVGGGTATWHLVFKPKKPVIFKSADFWVDGNGMPIQAKIIENNNDSTTVRLSDFKKNEPINSSIFQIKLAKGTKIVKTSSFDCSCFKSENPSDALENEADVVFSGKVVAVSGADYTFKAERVWKGMINNQVKVRTFAQEDKCSIKLTIGEQYIVFARNTKIEGKSALGLMPCNLTSKIISEKGEKILKEIGKGKSLKKVIINKKRRLARRYKKSRS
jgi:outer membrane lipoprotein-sorting protein